MFYYDFISNFVNWFFSDQIHFGNLHLTPALFAIPIMLGLPHFLEHLGLFKENDY